jgi:hypothetical protein
MMDTAMSILLDPTTRPPRFRLTPEEFAAVIAASPGDSAEVFGDRLRLRIKDTTGHLPPADKGRVKQDLQLAEIQDHAPDYIRESPLPIAERYALWKAPWSPPMGGDAPAMDPEEAKRVLARQERIAQEKNESIDDAIRRHLNKFWREAALRARAASMTELELARAIVGRMPLYDATRDAEAVTTLAGKLATLTKTELLFLDNYTGYIQWQTGMAAMLRGLKTQ